MADLIDELADAIGTMAQFDFNSFMPKVTEQAKASGAKLSAKRNKLIQTKHAIKDETAEQVIAKTYRPGQVQVDALDCRYGVLIDGEETVVEYIADRELRDTEQVPLLEEGGIEWQDHEALAGGGR